MSQSLPNILRNLKTAKKFYPPKPYLQIVNAISQTQVSSPPNLDPTAISFLSDLNPTSLLLILSDPNVRTSKGFKFLHFLLKNQSLISFKPDFQSHLILICRLLGARRFSEAQNLFGSVLIGENSRCPFPIIAFAVDFCCDETKIKAKLFNLMLKVYSDSGKFVEVLWVFDYMKSNGIRIDERTCTMHLITLKRADKMQLSLDFLSLMVEANVKISEYSSSVVISGLCSDGDIKRSRELVEEIIAKGTKPDIVVFNIMLNTCGKRWNFEELDLVLNLMEKERVEFNLSTYGILIDGFASFGKVEEARSLLQKMHDQSFKVGAHLYNLIISACSRVGSMESASLLFDEMSERGVLQNVDTYCAVICGFCKKGEMERAMEYVNEMYGKGFELDIVMFNALIEGFCSSGMIDKALKLQLIMERKGLNADLSVCEKIASGFCELNQPVEAKRLLNIMVKRGGANRLVSSSSFVDM
ncbi:hypothetical protein UlMin_028920 [Ulmus minor]